jgi:hypothetical protein
MSVETKGYKSYKYDVAISFAGEDRQIAENIAGLLKQHHIPVFYDDYEKADLWGKDLYEYLADVYSSHARYCVMIISAYYAEKLWTNYERRNAQERAFKEHEEYILPVRLDNTAIPGVRDTIGYIDLRKTSVEDLVDLILQKLGKSRSLEDHSEKNIAQSIPMPKIKKKFTDRGRDKFLKDSFSFIKGYFEKGLKELEMHQPGIDTDFTNVHEFMFLAKIYVHGNTKSQCKIWLGGLTSSTSILYSEGSMSIGNNDSYNDYLSIEDDGLNLFFRLSNMWFGFSGKGDDRVDEIGAAEYLWKRFTSHLEH